MRLIDADAFYEAQKARCGRPPLIGTCTRDNAFLDDELDKAPTIACAPERRRERWDDSGRFTFLNGEPAVRCSGCGACLRKKEYERYAWNFCPVCGADMRGETDGHGKT